MTDRFQVTILKDVREKLGLRPGDEVTVEIGAEGRIVMKRFARLGDPMKVLVGKKPYHRHVPIEELEENLETG